MDISTGWLSLISTHGYIHGYIHVWIYPWIYPWISISTATLVIFSWFSLGPSVEFIGKNWHRNDQWRVDWQGRFWGARVTAPQQLATSTSVKWFSRKQICLVFVDDCSDRQLGCYWAKRVKWSWLLVNQRCLSVAPTISWSYVSPAARVNATHSEHLAVIDHTPSCWWVIAVAVSSCNLSTHPVYTPSSIYPSIFLSMRLSA